MRRSSSLTSIDDTVQRNISNDKYDEVVLVGQNIDGVVVVATTIVPVIAEVLLADDRAAEALVSANNSQSSAISSQLSYWESEAARQTADSYATEAENVLVKIYTSNGDGTYTATSTTEYSSLHWESKSSASAAAALVSQNAAATSATSAGISEANADTSELNSQLSAWISEASRKTSSSYAAEVEDVFVKVYTSNGDGTYTSTDVTTYSALHYANKAATSAIAAQTSSVSSANSATAALTSQTAASVSESSAAISSTNALASQSAAATSATAASTSATSASTSADSAGISATDAGTSASNALASQNAATVSASNALASQNAAASSEINASTSATNAATSASTASAQAGLATTAYDSFDDRYLGDKAIAPTVDNDGNVLLVGALYFNTGVSRMNVWNGTVWIEVASSPILLNNTLTSISTGEALTAAQGKVLQDSKAPLDSPVLIGVPAAPTATVGTSTTQVATTAFVTSSVSTVVGTTNLGYIASATNGTVTSDTGTDAVVPLVVATGNAGLMTGTDKSKLDGVAPNANDYVHPTVDGSLHVPATSTTNNSKVLTAGPTAGSLSWVAPITELSTDLTPQLGGDLDVNGKAIIAPIEKMVAMGANDIVVNTGSVFTKTITAATTFTLSGLTVSGNVNSFILELTNGGAFTITWFSGVKWAGGTAPTLTVAGVDILGFYTRDGGVTWRGLVMAKDSK